MTTAVRRLSCAICISYVIWSWSALAQQTIGPSDGVIRLTKKEVVLDVIVRDHKGHPLNDLRADEVSVFEDGVQQKISEFRFVGGQEQLAAEKSAAKAEAATTDERKAVNSTREINYVSIVLAPMARPSLEFARQAVIQFLKAGDLPNTLVTLYRLDTRLRLIQPFTSDWAKLEKVSEAATSLQPGMAESFAQSALSTQSATTTLNAAASAATRGGGNPVLQQPSLSVNDPTFERFAGTLDASASAGAATQAETELESRLRFADGYVSGMTVEDDISELIRSQARLQGRKVVLYLSDGLTLPPDRPEIFQSLISDANRSGVTFYTVDTRGLTATSPEAPAIATLNQTVMDRSMADALQKGQVQGSSAFDAASTTRDLDRLMVSNTQLALQELAVRTGGVSTANTNEIARPMHRVMEEIRTHYELVYSPGSELYDGHFRKIEVKVARAKTTVQTRNGYYALPDLNGQPVQQYELAALGAINSRPLPTKFPFRSELLEFRPDSSGEQCQIAFEVPIASLSFERVGKSDNSRLHATLFAIVQDSGGQVIDKLSRDVFRELATKEIEKVRDDKIEYAEPVQLPPGHYTVSTVVTDQNLNQLSAQRRSVYVAPVTAGHLALSSVEVIKRVTPREGPRNVQDPFEMETQRVTPTLADKVASGQPVPLYFVIYPSRGTAPDGEPKMTIELFRDGKETSRSSVDLPKPDASGAIPMVAQLSLQPGAYTLQLTVRQGAQVAQAMRSLTVE